MLVNILTRYPAPPPVVLEQTLFENLNAFGGHSIAVTNRSLQPATVHNDQVFGSNAVIFALKSLEQTKVINVNGFGAHAIASFIPGTHYLEPTNVLNGSQFGAHHVRFATKLLTPALVTNTNQFGAATSIAAVEKTFSYSNPLGTGDRTSTITVTNSGGSTFDSPSKLVNGNTTENAFWGYGAITIKFDLGSPKIIRQARWIQNTSTTHSGLFQWQGSNDDTNYDDIGGTFNLGGAPVSLCNTLLDNAIAYRYCRLTPTAGASLSGTPYFREVEFYIEGSIDDPPD